jgi:hypothetical protein
VPETRPTFVVLQRVYKLTPAGVLTPRLAYALADTDDLFVVELLAIE